MTARGGSTSPFSERTRGRLGLAGFALLVYLPILWMRPGKVAADTKQYLYEEPGRFLARAASLWDPSFGMGTLTHQTIGYVFPMGPFHWLLQDVARVPAWASQRLWLGTLVLFAGLGIRYLLKTLDVTGPGVPVAMLAYAFSPYVVQYSGIYSVMLGPWAALPWWVAFTVLGLRRGGWRYPALFAVTVALVSSINASALVLALVGPLLWIPHALYVAREATWGRVVQFGWRTGLLTALTSLWWVVGLAVEGRYGVDILRISETLEIVSTTGQPFEALRGLGFWFFYGRDIVGPWNDAAHYYMRDLLVVFVSFLLPALALLAAGLLRWRHRAYFVALVVVGVVVVVGAAPYDDPSPAGALFKALAERSDTVFALRNTSRAGPLVALGLAVLLGVGVSALAARLRERGAGRVGLRVAVGVGALCVVNAVGSVHGAYYSEYLERDEQLPDYWVEAAAWIDAQPHDTRVLALPGADFASYRWGDTRDPIEPALTDRPYVARELVPWGTEPSVNLLRALDRRLQENVFETEALAPIARLMGVGDVLLRMDLETDRWGLIPASIMWQVFTERAVAGMDAPRTFGTEIPGELRFPEIGDLARPVDAVDDPPPVAVMRVEDALPILRTKPAAAPLVVSGDGEGLMDLAGEGLIDARRVVLYSAWFEDDPDALRDLPEGAALVVTDSNRRRGQRWSRMYGNYGYTERAGEEPLEANPLDHRLDPFPEASDGTRTVTRLDGVREVRATTYGDQIFGFTPSDRPTRALDADLKTGWVVRPGLPVGRERLRIDLDGPLTTDRVNLVQPLQERQERWITGVTLRFDGTDEVRARLDASSREKRGQDVVFETRTFSTLEIVIDGVRDPAGLAITRKNPVGFAEVRFGEGADRLGRVRVGETTRLPVDLLSTLGDRSLDHPLAFVMSRDVIDESGMHRELELPTPREFTLSGTAVLARAATDQAIDRRIGLLSASEGGVTATSRERYGDVTARASAAIDGDLATAWNSSLGANPVDNHVRVEVPEPVTVDRLDLHLVEDGRHSSITALEIRNELGESRPVDLSSSQRTPGPHGTVAVPVTFDALTGRTFFVEITGFEQLRRSELRMPVAIAELGLPGVVAPPAPEHLPDDCIDDLISIDGTPFPVRVTGTTEDALRQRPLTIEPCDPGASVRLGAGAHRVAVRTGSRAPGAIDVSRLVLSSGAGGAAAPPSTVGAFDAGDAGSAPELSVTASGRVRTELEIAGASEPFWLVLGQSHNEGWRATLDGKDLGDPVLVDGYANGWLVDPTGAEGPLSFVVEYEPQRTIRAAMAVSAAALLLCLLIVVVPSLRRRPVGHGATGLVAEAAELRIGPLEERGVSRRGGVVVVSLLAGIGVALLVHPLVGLAAVILTHLACRSRRWRFAQRIAPAAIVGGVAVYVMLTQLVHAHPARAEWPGTFDAARIPTWVALTLVGIVVLVDSIFVKDDEGSGS